MSNGMKAVLKIMDLGNSKETSHTKIQSSSYGVGLINAFDEKCC